MALVVAQEVPTSSSMAVPHGPAGVGKARHRMRAQLRSGGVAESVIDDAVLILSELLSNACRHGRPLGDAPAGDGDVRAAWRVDARGRLLVEVTDGGGPTRPAPATPSVTAHGGRGLNIITALADDWGVRDDVEGEVTVWVVVHGDVHDPDAGCPRDPFATRVTRPVAREAPLADLAREAPLADLALPAVATAPETALTGAVAGEVPLPRLSPADESLPDLPLTAISDATLTGITTTDVPLSGLTTPGLALPDLSGLDFTDAFEDLD